MIGMHSHMGEYLISDDTFSNNSENYFMKFLNRLLLGQIMKTLHTANWRQIIKTAILFLKAQTTKTVIMETGSKSVPILVMLVLCITVMNVIMRRVALSAFLVVIHFIQKIVQIVGIYMTVLIVMTVFDV